MNKFTPGPWHIIGGYNIYSELGAMSGDGKTADARDGWHVASIGDAPTFVDGESVYLGRDVQRANARLIAAAPDLLDALEDCANWLDWLYHPDHDDKQKSNLIRIKRARAAIARARGQS